MSVPAELSRYAQILEIDPGFKGGFSTEEKSLRKKMG